VVNRNTKTKGLRIVYLVDFYRTENAGTERQLAHLLRRMPDFGYSVQLVSLQGSPFLKNEAGSAFDKVRFKTLAADSDLSRTPGALIRLYCHLKRCKPDIVHAFFPTSNSVGIMVARLAGIRRLISSRRDMGYNLNGRDVALLKCADRFVSFVIVNSKMVGERTAKRENLSPEKLRIVYNGIAVTKPLCERRLLGRGAPVMGIVANLNRQVKRVDLFVEAAVVVARQFPDARFWIVGDGDLRAGLERLVSELFLDLAFTFLGRRADVDRLLPEMYSGVMCSDSEGLSNSIMEYMEAGLPVVATDVGGNSELVKDGITGILVPPGDKKALADALMALLRNPERASAMGAAGRRVVAEQFSLGRMIQDTTAIYRECMNSLL
jgi:L-malate glycosyltransferase